MYVHNYYNNNIVTNATVRDYNFKNISIIHHASFYLLSVHLQDLGKVSVEKVVHLQSCQHQSWLLRVAQVPSSMFLCITYNCKNLCSAPNLLQYIIRDPLVLHYPL